MAPLELGQTLLESSKKTNVRNTRLEGLQQISGRRIRRAMAQHLRGGEQGSEGVRQESTGRHDKESGHRGLESIGNGFAVGVGKHSFKWIHVLMRLSFKVKNVDFILPRLSHLIMNNSNHRLWCNFKSKTKEAVSSLNFIKSQLSFN